MTNIKETIQKEMIKTETFPAIQMSTITVLTAAKGIKSTVTLPQGTSVAKLKAALNAAGTDVTSNINIQVMGRNYPSTAEAPFESINVMLTPANGFYDDTPIPSGNLAIATQSATAKGRSEYSEAKAKVKALYGVAANKERIKEICNSHGKGNYTHCNLLILNEIIAEFSASNVADVVKVVKKAKSKKAKAKITKEVKSANVANVALQGNAQLDRIEKMVGEALAMTYSNSSAIKHLMED